MRNFRKNSNIQVIGIMWLRVRVRSRFRPPPCKPCRPTLVVKYQCLALIAFEPFETVPRQGQRIRRVTSTPETQFPAWYKCLTFMSSRYCVSQSSTFLSVISSLTPCLPSNTWQVDGRQHFASNTPQFAAYTKWPGQQSCFMARRRLISTRIRRANR